MHIYIYFCIYIYVGCTTVSWRCVCRLGDGTSNGNVETENNDPQVDLGLGIWYFYTRPYTESTWIKCCNGRTLTLGLFDLTTVAVRMGIEHTRAWTNAGSHEVVKERPDRKIRKYPVDEWKYIAASTGVSAIVWWGSQVLSFCICNHVVLRGSSTDSYFFSWVETTKRIWFVHSPMRIHASLCFSSSLSRERVAHMHVDLDIMFAPVSGHL